MIINNLCKQFVIIYSLNFKILRVIECTLADWTQYSSDYIKNAVKNRFFQRRILIENTGSVLNFSHFNVRPFGLTSTLFSVLKQITRPTLGLNVIVQWEKSSTGVGQYLAYSLDRKIVSRIIFTLLSKKTSLSTMQYCQFLQLILKAYL